MAQKISTLPLGAKVKDNDTKYYEKPIIWKIADKNHEGYPEDTVTLISDKILCYKAFDAGEPAHHFTEYGNRNYHLSNIHQWLNADQLDWFRPQHPDDLPPTKENVTFNPYDKEKGFLGNFSKMFREILQTTTVKTIFVSHTTKKIFEIETKDKIFLPSIAECSLPINTMIKNIQYYIRREGIPLSLFTTPKNTLAYPTHEAIRYNETPNFQPKYDQISSWWLRTPYMEFLYFKNNFNGDNYETNVVEDNNALYYYSAKEQGIGIRPLCNIKADTLVADTPDAEGIYKILWSIPPTAPSNITVPQKVKADTTLTITWEKASDKDNNLAGYILERKVDNSTYEKIYQGTATSYTDTIKRGWQTITYRVKAYDNKNETSDYQTSSTITVDNNREPLITTTAKQDLGTQKAPFKIDYSVLDPDQEQTLTIREYFDNKEKRNFTATSTTNYSFTITKEEWTEILNGTHKIKITATDSASGKVEKEIIFTKNETEILFELKTPLQADAKVTRAMLLLIGEIPKEATAKIEITNNAYDKNPTWEDVTKQVAKKAKIFLTNQEKTATKWGVNIRVSIKKNNIKDPCYISAICGTFD